ncbi:MAG: hypothetical protein Q8K65_02745 [Alphaproteobacteria bacterium]|nr:hypothetical protein [Alphaproteobacteria bacterium]
MMRATSSLLVLLALFFAPPALAQDVISAQPAVESSASAQPDTTAQSDAVGVAVDAAEAGQPAAEPVAAPATVKTPFRGTLLFSGVEIAALREAAAGRRSNEAFLDAEKTELIPVDRKIKLSGIYYKDDATWIVWLNGYKLHPSYLLKEIHRIDVKKDEIFLSWYDIGLNDVINIKMRPHQVYDIVTGILYNDTAGGSQ